MTAKEKMTAPIASVGADVEQPLQNLKTNQSIADLPGKVPDCAVRPCAGAG